MLVVAFEIENELLFSFFQSINNHFSYKLFTPPTPSFPSSSFPPIAFQYEIFCLLFLTYCYCLCLKDFTRILHLPVSGWLAVGGGFKNTILYIILSIDSIAARSILCPPTEPCDGSHPLPCESPAIDELVCG